MKQGNGLPGRKRRLGLAILFYFAGSISGWAQATATEPRSSDDNSTSAAIHDLQRQVTELRTAMEEVRSEAAQYRAENQELRRELESVRHLDGQQPYSSHARVDPDPGPRTAGQSSSYSANSTETSPPQSLAARVASLEESTQLLNSKVDDQYQTKVESASKYRVRLYGMLLLNLFSNQGTTNNFDVPDFALGRDVGNESFGATLRQSEIGLEVFGPTLLGARTSGNVQADFAGGFADTWNGVNSGLFRLQIASVRMDWAHTSVVAGQDSLFISPLSPTTFASVEVPGFNYEGNLWAWTPQVRVEHRFELANDERLTVQGGIFDNLTGEFPPSSYFRSPGPGEATGQPAYGFRTAWSRTLFGQPLTLGAGGYYGRQDWEFDHYADSWAGMVDWDVPLPHHFELSGEFYRGRGIGGIGGGTGRSVLYSGNPDEPATLVNPLNAIGGWSQLKFRANSKLEFNAGFGLDNPKSSEVRAAEVSENYVGPLLVQNRSALGNFIYRPRSNLLFSAEYRHIQSLELDSESANAQQFNLMMGILF